MCGRGAAASEANQYANQIKKLTHQQIIVSGTCAFAPSSNLAPGRNVPVLVCETGENRNEKQKMSAEKMIEAENKKLNGKVVTQLSLLKNYCTAEEYHQKYLDKKF